MCVVRWVKLGRNLRFRLPLQYAFHLARRKSGGSSLVSPNPDDRPLIVGYVNENWGIGELPLLTSAHKPMLIIIASSNGGVWPRIGPYGRPGTEDAIFAAQTPNTTLSDICIQITHDHSRVLPQVVCTLRQESLF